MTERLFNNKKELITYYDEEVTKVFQNFDWEVQDKSIQDITNDINNICESMISNGRVHSATPNLNKIFDDAVEVSTKFEYGVERKKLVYEITIFYNRPKISN